MGNQELLGNIQRDLIVTYPIEARRERVLRLLDHVIAEEIFTCGVASSFRGQILGMSVVYAGEVGRGQMHFLSERCFSERDDLFPELVQSFEFHRHLARVCPSRVIDISSSSAATCLLYTDASYGFVHDADGTILRLCWTLIDPLTKLRVGWSCDVPHQVLAQLPDQATYIANG